MTTHVQRGILIATMLRTQCKLRVFRSFVATIIVFSIVSETLPVLADDVVPSAPIAAQTMSPTNEQIMTSNGTLPLRWQPDSSATRYRYEVEYNLADSWYSAGKGALGTTAKTSATATLDKYFVRQFGGSGISLRWRVTTLDDTGKTLAVSDWTTFRFKQSSPAKRPLAKKKKVVRKKLPVKSSR